MLKLTPWFCAATQPPVRAGWYEYKFAPESQVHRRYFSEQEWHFFCSNRRGFKPYRGDRWRGVLKD